jgi:hypothetical protein
MSDAGEGLVDAESRLQEAIDAREHEKRRRGMSSVADPEKHRTVEGLRLAKLELERQREGTTHPVRLQSIDAAIKEIDKRMASA